MMINKRKFTEFIEGYKQADEFYNEYLRLYNDTVTEVRWTYLETAFMWMNRREEIKNNNLKLYYKAKELRVI